MSQDTVTKHRFPDFSLFKPYSRTSIIDKSLNITFVVKEFQQVFRCDQRYRTHIKDCISFVTSLKLAAKAGDNTNDGGCTRLLAVN